MTISIKNNKVNVVLTNEEILVLIQDLARLSIASMVNSFSTPIIFDQPENSKKEVLGNGQYAGAITIEKLSLLEPKHHTGA